MTRNTFVRSLIINFIVQENKENQGKNANLKHKVCKAIYYKNAKINTLI